MYFTKSPYRYITCL